MPCPKTEHLLKEYFADDLAAMAGEEIERHLSQCEECGMALEELLLTQSSLKQWQDERVPHWDRGMELFRREHRAPQPARNWFNAWQWMPTAASFAMLALLLFNTTLTVGGNGLSLSFGGESTSAESIAQLQAQQRDEFQAMIARFEDRQDSNNVQLMQAVMAQTQQATADNLNQIYAYFEDQRLQDMQAMSQSYQQLADSDYATIQSLQDLAQFVSFQGSVQ